MSESLPGGRVLRALTRQEVRELDRRAIEEFAVPGLLLMENAGRGAAVEAWDLLTERAGRRVVVLAGAGNNGGDGFVIARHLFNWGCAVSVFCFVPRQRVAGDAAVNLAIIERMGLPIAEVAWAGGPTQELAEAATQADLLVDALFGTGVNSPLRAPFPAVIAWINALGKCALAVDIPSGLNCDTGEPMPVAVRAARTVSFVSAKAGFSAPGAERYTGRVVPIEIGIPRQLLAEYLSAPEVG
jgi:NAD(P)H-hydrate epimerase